MRGALAAGPSQKSILGAMRQHSAAAHCGQQRRNGGKETHKLRAIGAPLKARRWTRVNRPAMTILPGFRGGRVALGCPIELPRKD